MEGELIFLGFIMLVGQIILLQMWQNNWFKKENFKLGLANTRATNKLNLDKLRKELGLTKEVAAAIPAATPLGGVAQFLPLLKNLDGEQIASLAETFLGGGGEETAAPSGIVEQILDVVPPEMIESFLKGLAKKEGVASEGGFIGQGQMP